MSLRPLVKFTMLMVIFMVTAGFSTYLTVHLLIRGEDTVVVPELTGKDVVYALQLLSDLGLNTKVKGAEYHAEVPKNYVISQTPEAGREIKKGRDVRIVISKGARSVVLPNVTGLGISQARIFLEKNDLRQGRLSYTFSDVRPKEDVLAQYPIPGVHGLRGANVDLLISSGPRPIFLPMVDLKGMGFHQAMDILEKRHLLAGTSKMLYDLSIGNDVVVDHTPAGGYPVPLGGAVDLTINRHNQRVLVGRPDGLNLFRHRMGEGFLKQHVRVMVTRPVTALDIFDGYVRPGKEIWLLVPQDEPSTLFLYVDEELVKTLHFD